MKKLMLLQMKSAHMIFVVKKMAVTMELASLVANGMSGEKQEATVRVMK